MLADLNPKIIGAVVVGLALVAGAYTISTFGRPTMAQPAAVGAAEAPPRTAIEVVDHDENGIEDWRDEFVTTEPIMLDQATTSYTPPTTLTGQLGINLLEGFVRARSAGPFGRSKEELISDTVDGLTEETAITLYDQKHIIIMQTWDENDIRNYGNAMAGAILNINVGTNKNELSILSDVLTRGKSEELGELKLIASGYKSLRDTSLAIPVPSLFAKQHLDIINTYNAVYKDVDAMSLSVEDPVVALMAIKRYEDDVLGMKLAMENMYSSLEPYSGLFTQDDPAGLFATFSATNQGQ